jgi:hypothetical protein
VGGLIRLALPVLLTVALTGCGRSPPKEMAGFGLGMSQDQVVTEAARHGGFTCHLSGTRPRLATCAGTTAQGPARVRVRENQVVAVSLEMDPGGRRPQRAMRRFTRRFGEPAWEERPFPTPFDSITGYHTLWLNRDSTRALGVVCAGRRLAPPCTAELSRTSPDAVEMKLDSLLGIVPEAAAAAPGWP